MFIISLVRQTVLDAKATQYNKKAKSSKINKLLISQTVLVITSVLFII